MPLQWAIDHGARTVVATGIGSLRFADIRDYFHGLTPATLSYRKLLNIADCSLDLTRTELTALAEHFNGLRLRDGLGPAAVVVASVEMHRQISDFKAMTASARPLEVFYSCDAAYGWLKTHRSEPMSPFETVDGADERSASP